MFASPRKPRDPNRRPGDIDWEGLDDDAKGLGVWAFTLVLGWLGLLAAFWFGGQRTLFYVLLGMAFAGLVLVRWISRAHKTNAPRNPRKVRREPTIAESMEWSDERTSRRSAETQKRE